MQIAALVLAAALAAALVSCTSAPPPADAPPPPCDLVSCAAGMALECCPPMTPRRTLVIPALGWAPAVNWTPGPGCMRSQGSGRFVIPVVALEGDRLTSLGASILGNGMVDVNVAALYAGISAEGTGLGAPLGEIAVVDAISRWTEYTADLADVPAAATGARWIEIAADQVGACIGAVRLTYDHPGF